MTDRTAQREPGAQGMTKDIARKPHRRKSWLIDIMVGGIGGGVVGAVVAVNVVIYSGIEGGYEATIPEVFRENIFVGLVAVAILVAGPLIGVSIARRVRHQRASG